jgi:hypothetical protein
VKSSNTVLSKRRPDELILKEIVLFVISVRVPFWAFMRIIPHDFLFESLCVHAHF